MPSPSWHAARPGKKLRNRRVRISWRSRSKGSSWREKPSLTCRRWPRGSTLSIYLISVTELVSAALRAANTCQHSIQAPRLTDRGASHVAQDARFQGWIPLWERLLHSLLDPEVWARNTVLAKIHAWHLEAVSGHPLPTYRSRSCQVAFGFRGLCDTAAQEEETCSTTGKRVQAHLTSQHRFCTLAQRSV